MKITTKQLVQTAVLLAICLVSQYFKNLSVYITGPIVNAVLIIATIGIGLGSGIILSIIAPITAFFFTGSPIMAGIPLMFPTIMIGNIIIVVVTYFFYKKCSFNGHLPVGLILGSAAKAAFMGLVIVMVLLPIFGDNIAVPAEKLPVILAVAKTTFSITQLITSLLGSVYAYIIWIPLKKVMQNEQ